MVSVKAFSTDLCATGSHPAWLASALAITGSAQATILAGTLLGAVEAIGSIGARYGAVLALPARHAEASARHRVAFASILAFALLRTVVAPLVHRAGLAAPQTHIASAALALTGDVVAGTAIAVHALWTHLRAVLAIVASWAWFAAVLAHPSPFADANASLWIARRVVLAVAGVLARGTPLATGALTFTGHSFNARSTDALASDVITSQGVLPIALAFIFALQSIFPMITLGLAELPKVTW